MYLRKKQVLIVLFAVSAFCSAGQQLSTPDISSLSVDPATGNIVLKWRTPNVSENVSAHEISIKQYVSPNYFFNPDDSVSPPDTVYTAPSSNIETQRVGCRLRNRNDTDMSPISDMHITMQFAGVYNSCENAVSLRWTEYRRFAIDENGQTDLQNPETKKFNDNVEYEVWGHFGNSFDISAAVRLVAAGRQNSDITIANLEIGTTCYLYVKAVLPNGDTATSHRIEIPVTGRRFPSVMNIDTVVNKNGMVYLYLNVDRNTDVDTFAIYRSDERIPLEWYYSADEVSGWIIDQTASIGQVYKYNIVGFVCGKPLLKSDTVTNIIMYASPLGLDAEIRWTEFFNETAVPTYTLIRTQPSELKIDPGNSLHFIDKSTNDSACYGPQRFCYIMTAQTEKSFARSEQSCISVSQIITMPDAIDPASDIAETKNCSCETDCINRRRLFGPVTDLNDIAYKMELEIYDRSGIKLFASKKNFGEPLLKEFHFWDGTYKGNRVKPGIYVYYARIEFKNADHLTFRGGVTVVM
ncbi:MAG: gliding motility-associated C-terminal domain-containing protein [Prevotellaceae bacterium]|jgi:hypothetical protein|nr:gliding motility-associated C-terminal domain-containing protein [Prevotellaceae bacterium]